MSDLARGLLHVNRQTYPGRGGLVTKATKGRRRRVVPIIDPLRPTLERPTAAKAPDARLLVGPKGGVITTATLRDATGWDELVSNLGLGGLARHGLRHSARVDGGQLRPAVRAAVCRRAPGPGRHSALSAPGYGCLG